MKETKMTAQALAARAAQRGYTLHESVTDERLARIHPCFLNGKPDRVSSHLKKYLYVPPETVDQWTKAGYYIAPYRLGNPGDEVISRPTTDQDLMLVYLPSFWVVATCRGIGETSSDDEKGSSIEMTFTILSRLPIRPE